MVGLLMTACSSNDFSGPVATSNEDGMVTFEVSLTVPERGTAGTRAFGEAPDYNDLHLYLVEFDYKGEPLDNGISGVYLAQEETPTPSSKPDRIVFKVTLRQAAEPKILHLIAVPKAVDLSFGEYGMEGNIIPALVTTNGNEAYWQRLEFPNGYGEMTVVGEGENKREIWTVLQEAKDKLTMVPMIRNFAKLTVQLSTTLQNANKFRLEGYALLNVPTAGTVAPWNSDTFQFPGYVDASKKQIDYDKLDYPGIMAGNITRYDVADNAFNTDPEYFYERRYSSVDHTQLIIKGNYNNEGSSYYKIDLGLQQNGRFNFFNLLRNFNYVVTITDVGASGYDSAAAAKDGVVYNNLSFDLDTQKMLNISNGTDMLWVNFTTAVISQNTDAARTLQFGYRYRQNITTGNTLSNDSISVIGLEGGKGEVISSVREITPPTGYADWKYYEIKTYAPDDNMKTQSFVVVNNKTGLGRTINLILTNPWEVTNYVVFGGNYDYAYPSNNATLGIVGDGAQAPLTLFFDIPGNLPEAIFPLSFNLESDMQNIENNPVGTLSVTSGTSSWPGIVGRRIKYVKTVTWSDYNNKLSSTYPTGVLMDNPNDAAKPFHRVRCRLRTITSLANLGIDVGASVTSTIRITNSYFTSPTIPGTDPAEHEDGGYIDATFTRTRTNN